MEDEVKFAVGEAAVIGGLRLLGVWVPTFAKIELAGKLALPAMGAGAVWLLAKPWGDDEITKCWTAWRTCNQKFFQMRNRQWDPSANAIKATWPEGTDRKAFDAFMENVLQEVIQVEQALGRLADVVQEAQNDIHKIMHAVGLLVDALLAIIIVAEIMQAVPFPPTQAAATAVLNSSGVLLMGATSLGVGAIAAALLYSFGSIQALAAADTKFPTAQANFNSDSLDANTDFKDIKVQNMHQKGWTYD